MKLSKIKPNPNNPRTIRDWKFDKLKKSILEFPKMLDLRPIVIDSDFVILGGNMRFRVLQDLAKSGELEGLIGLDKNEIPDSWVRKAEELTEDESRRFILADNGDFGEWDFDALANEWDEIEIKEWAGIEIPDFKEISEQKQDLSTKIDINYRIEIVFDNEAEQEKIYNEMTERGYNCRVLTL